MFKDLIVRILGDTRSLKKDMAKATAQMNGFRRSVSNVATSMGVAFGGAVILSGIRKAFNSIVEFESQMAKVNAVSRSTADQFKSLKDNALDLGATTRYTATEIGGMQEVMARLGFSAEQITKATDATRKLATAAGEELAPSADLMVKTLNAFNLSSEESTRVANTMAESFATTSLNLEQYSVGMSYASTAGRIFGLELEDVTAMLGVLVDNGIQGTKAGTGLRDIFSDLSKTGMTLEEAYAAVNSSANKSVTAFDLVGKTSQNQLIILAENAEKVDDLAESYKDTTLEMNKMVDVMEGTLNHQLKILSSTWDGLVQKGGALEPVFSGIIQLMIGALGGDMKGGFFDVSALSAGELTDKIEKLNFQLEQTKSKYDRGIYSTAEFNDETEKLNKTIAEANERLATLEGGAWPVPFKIAPPIIEKVTNKVKELSKEIMSLPPLLLRNTEASTDDLFAVDLENYIISTDKLLGNIKNVKLEFEELPNIFQNGIGAINAMGQAFLDMDKIAQNFANTMLVGLGEALGNAFSGVSNFGEDMLRALGGFMAQLGQQMIELGVAKAALQMSLSNPLVPGGVLIAAGVALIATSKVLQNSFSGGLGAANSGASSGSTGSRTGSSTFGLGGEAEDKTLNLNLNAIIEGDKLRFILDKSDRNRGIGG